jgi:hypothetical protein
MDGIFESNISLGEREKVMNNYTHEWEVLETRLCGFTDEKLLKMYICGLQDYIDPDYFRHEMRTEI